MKHVDVPFFYSVHVSTPIRGRNGWRGDLLFPLRLLPSRKPYPLRSSSHLGATGPEPGRQRSVTGDQGSGCSSPGSKSAALLPSFRRRLSAPQSACASQSSEEQVRIVP